MMLTQVDTSDYVRLVLSRHAKSDASKKTSDSKTHKVGVICTPCLKKNCASVIS